MLQRKALPAAQGMYLSIYLSMPIFLKVDFGKVGNCHLIIIDLIKSFPYLIRFEIEPLPQPKTVEVVISPTVPSPVEDTSANTPNIMYEN